MSNVNDATLESIARTRAIVEFLFSQYLETKIDVKDGYIKDAIANNIEEKTKIYVAEMKN